jgi:hypothetical protein
VCCLVTVLRCCLKIVGVPKKVPGRWQSVRTHMAAGRRQRCIGACLLWYLAMVTLVGGGVTEEVDETEAAGVVRAMRRKIKVDRSSLPYKLTAANGKANSGFWSQAGHDKIVDELLQGATGLFFVEAGGYDGETHSNSLFFEHSRAWQGMVIEPNPHLYTQILGKHRHCMTVNAAISPQDHQDQLPFVLAGPLGGFASTLSEGHQKRIEDEIAAKKSWMNGELGSGKTIMVESYPLEWLLEAGNQTKLVVDYWSLDTEGSEPHILRATNFSRIQVGVMSIEHNGEEDKQRGIRDAMVSTGLVLYRDLGGDYIYVNPTYLSERGWNSPIRSHAVEVSAPGTEEEAASLFDVFEDTNNVYGLVGSSDYVHYLGIQESRDACAFACVHYFLSSGGAVKMGSYVWHPRNFPSLEWRGYCFGRSEAFDVWNPTIQKGAISGRVRPARWRRWLEQLSTQQRTLLQASDAGALSQNYPLV